MYGLTVKELIKQLRKMPQEAIVVWQDHDHSDDEYNGFVKFVWELDNDLQGAVDIETPIVSLRG